MKFLSVCSGIEAASVAWAPLGWKAVAFSEIEPFPCSALAHHYPDVPNWGDMTKYEEWPLVPIDLLCGGTPCQAFSVAGLRGGLDDARGNLMLTFAAIARKYRPKWVVWENVPGVLSSNGGSDFGSLLGLFSGRAITVPAGGWSNSGVVPGIEGAYGLAWRVLDAQYAGVPQRRRRVFLVGRLGDWRRAAAVLLERHSLSGHPAPRRQAGQGLAAATAPSLTASGRGVERSGESRGQDPVVAVFAPEVARNICTREGTSQDWETTAMVAHSLRAEGFDASEDGTGRGTPLVPVSFDQHYQPSEITSTLLGGGSGGRNEMNHPVVAYAATDYETGAFDRVEAAGPLTTSADRTRAAPILAFSAKDHGGDAMDDCSPTLRAGGHSGSHANAGVMPAVVMGADTFNGALTGDIAATMGTRGSSETASGPVLLTAMQVRRLTPRECERLQGFPDDYTLVPHRSKEAADGPRYKALGNSWAVPCARWIGERIAAVEAL